MKSIDYIKLIKHSTHIQTKENYIVKFDKYILEFNSYFIQYLTDKKPTEKTIKNLLSNEYFKLYYLIPIFEIIYSVTFPIKTRIIYDSQLNNTELLYTDLLFKYTDIHLKIMFETYKEKTDKTYTYTSKDKIRIQYSLI